MSRYFDWPASLKRFVRFDAARSEDVNGAFDELTAGMDKLDTDVNRAIKLPAGTADQTLAMGAGQRANLLLSFDASGNVTAVAGGGRYRGDWVTGTAYVTSDYFRDPASKNIYSTVAAHTSGVLATDITAGRVQLAVNVADVEAAKTAAAASAALAAAQVALAAEQAALATRNGSAQVALAAEQAALATRNGSAQVALAAGQADRATTQADAARAIANFAGVWSTLTGPLNKPATVYHAGLFYVLVNNLASVSASEPGVTADWIASDGGIPSYTYDQRGDLRASGGRFAVVDGLGLFRHVAGSDEPDDDESCFATATGRWLLQAVHWDVVDTWQLPDDEARDAYDEDEPLRFASSFASKVLTGSATCAITSVAAVASTAFTGAVTGAAVGDRVIATPPAALGNTDADSGRLSYHAWVSAADTVTVRLTNASAAAATTNTAIRAAWPITVIKS